MQKRGILTLARASRLLQSRPTSTPHHNHDDNHILQQQSTNDEIHLASPLTAVELASYCHAIATYGEEKLNLNAFSHLLSWGDVYKQAKESQERINQNRPLSPLDGLPISIKANIAVEGLPLTAQSDILRQEVEKMQEDIRSNADTNTCIGGMGSPCGYDSIVAQRLLRKCGAVLIGLTTMDEFGMGSLGTNLGRRNSKRFTVNPLSFPSIFHHKQKELNMHKQSSSKNSHNLIDEYWKERIRCISNDPTILHQEQEEYYLQHHPSSSISLLSTGGSSSGSAASICHGSSLASIGTDTGGSVRLPAAWCGLVGMKPTYGAISRHGVVSYASSLDTVGVLANSVSCATMVLNHLVNRKDKDKNTTPCVGDSTAIYFPSGMNFDCSNTSFPPFSSTTTKSSTNDQIHTAAPQTQLKGITIGIPAAFCLDECPSNIQKAWLQAAQTLTDHGATIQIVDTNHLSSDTIQRCLPAYYVLACAEASSNLARYDGLRYGPHHDNDMDDNNHDNLESTSDKMTPLEKQYSKYRAQYFGKETIRRILCGTAVLSSDQFHTHYEAAARVRAQLCLQMQKCFKDTNSHNDNSSSNTNTNEGFVDMFLVPTALFGPPILAQKPNTPGNMNDDAKVGDTTSSDAMNSHKIDATQAFANDVMTIPPSLGGLPSISIPMRTSSTHDGRDGLDDIHHGIVKDNYNHSVFGLQLFGPKLSENILAHAASVLERNS